MSISCEAQGRTEKIEHVVTHETTTGAAITFPVVVAVIALISSIFSIYLSFRLKDKEYRNDYYKKVIEKRIKAIEGTEKVLGLFSITTTLLFVDEDETEMRQKIHTFLYKNVEVKEGDAWWLVVDEISPLTIWLSKETKSLLDDFGDMVSSIRRDISMLESIDSVQYNLMQAYDVIEEKKLAIEKNIARDMEFMYDVNSFFKAKQTTI